MSYVIPFLMTSNGIRLDNVLTKDCFVKRVESGDFRHSNYRYLEFESLGEAQKTTSDLLAGKVSPFDFMICSVLNSWKK